MSSIGTKIAFYRKAKGMTQDELEKKIRDFISRQGVYESPVHAYALTCGQSVPKCGHIPGK